MFRQAIRESKPSAQLLFAAFVIFLCGIAVTVLGIVIAWVIFGVNLSEMESLMKDLSKPDNVLILKFFQTTQSIGVFIIPPFIVAWFLQGKPSVYLQYRKSPDFQSILLVMAIVFFSNPLINWLNEVNANLALPEWMHSVEIWMKNSEDQATKITEAFLSTTSLSVLLGNIIMVGVLPAVGEELLFRGIIQQLFKKIFGNAHTAIWVSAALFSALHLQFFGFLPRLVLGAMFGYMLEWSGNLWLPVIAHFINNTVAVIAFYRVHNGLMSDHLDKTGTLSDGSFYLVIISLILLSFFFRKLYLKRETHVEAGG